MLTLPRFCFVIVIATIFSLGWVHQQVKLVTTSYEIAQKEKELSNLELIYSRLRYRVLTLESPNHLDEKLHQTDKKLSFRDPIRVVHVTEESKRTKLAKNKNSAHSSLIAERYGFWEFFLHSAEAKQRNP